ncbi:MAG: type II toxin-antitoxin system RelE/ParE family toxin [Rhizomicrobium sp.]
MTARIITAGALHQIDRIYDYLARHDAGAAQRVVDRIYKIIDLVTERPHIGRRMRERGVRMYVVKPYPYIVFYRYVERSDEVCIIRVRHAAMRRGGLQEEAPEFRAAANS